MHMEANETFFHYDITSSGDITITPYVEAQRVLLMNNYGGMISVDKQLAKKGETVKVTVKPNAGNKLKCIKTVPANAVQFKELEVNHDTGTGTYSFVMPTSYLTLIGVYDVTVTTEQERSASARTLP